MYPFPPLSRLRLQPLNSICAPPTHFTTPSLVSNQLVRSGRDWLNVPPRAYLDCPRFRCLFTRLSTISADHYWFFVHLRTSFRPFRSTSFDYPIVLCGPLRIIRSNADSLLSITKLATPPDLSLHTSPIAECLIDTSALMSHRLHLAPLRCCVDPRMAPINASQCHEHFRSMLWRRARAGSRMRLHGHNT
ncbi:hypothetical protein HYPSUDRAFT_914240 [Hypholoma sublateritium FD-334 SS-4]|uniref:Uncharacterized protein n=1 Tax=Hypholoma sublateritium (strain FD-334 SS-4) TaxID=945553 RepID=A0A0D2PF76_HYPSF|nr:hypothetical protein HYPSUDRAFT_914240 [Hypholoma sublateritium FD-334 SS-4]